MGSDTKIQWTDATWNPIRGCTRISEGCRHCYAESVAARFSGPGMAYEGLARMSENGPRWTGKLMIVSAHLEDPLRWKKPRRVFVNSMSDLFHEKLTNEHIARVFRVMLNAPRHTYQVLTKRAQRMQEFVEWFRADRGEELPGHIQLGVSAEDQPNADERLPWLERTSVPIKFVSVEPQIGPVSLARWLGPKGGDKNGRFKGITWVIVGGESGHRPRPFDVQWARALVEECRVARAAVFVKQLGGAPFDSTKQWEPNDAAEMPGHGPPIEQWDPTFAIRQFPTELVAA